ncbi:MAG TPA: hypothetical protein VEY09_05670 [Pyrinomonadaceae bacterium]|nr:hypothetical protein [Pyrinomonadaceae bacterium]
MNVPNTSSGVEPFTTHAANFRLLRAAGDEGEEGRDRAREDDSPPETPDTSPSSADPLEEAARQERDYVRRRLAEEMGREPSEEELSEWLRRHTEGH